MLRRRSRGVGRLLRARRVECGMLRRSFLRPLLCLSEGRVLCVWPWLHDGVKDCARAESGLRAPSSPAQPLKGDGGAVGALVRVNFMEARLNAFTSTSVAVRRSRAA